MLFISSAVVLLPISYTLIFCWYTPYKYISMNKNIITLCIIVVVVLILRLVLATIDTWSSFIMYALVLGIGFLTAHHMAKSGQDIEQMIQNLFGSVSSYYPDKDYVEVSNHDSVAPISLADNGTYEDLDDSAPVSSTREIVTLGSMGASDE